MTPQQVLQLCATHFGVSVDQMRGPSRVKPLPLARSLAAYLLIHRERMSASEVGRLMGKDRSGVASAAHKFRLLLQCNGDNRAKKEFAAVSGELTREPESGVGFTVAVCALHPEEPAHQDCEGWTFQFCHRCMRALGQPSLEPKLGSLLDMARDLLLLEDIIRGHGRHSA
jgi:hypothetical protein